MDSWQRRQVAAGGKANHASIDTLNIVFQVWDGEVNPISYQGRCALPSDKTGNTISRWTYSSQATTGYTCVVAESPVDRRNPDFEKGK